jgi:perosamine synthetase
VVNIRTLISRGTALKGAFGLVATARVRNAKRLDAGLAGLAGITTPSSLPKGAHSYWRYCLRVDPAVVPGGPGAMATQLRDYDVASAPRYVQKPAFRCQVFRDQVTFGNSRWPFTEARPEAVDYSADRYPGSFGGLEGILVFPYNEQYTEAHVDHLVTSIRAAHGKLMEDGE